MPRAKKIYDAPKHYACFTPEQQEYFNKLPKRQRAYVEFRGQGYSKTVAYKMSGYDGKVAGQAAYMLEQRNKGIAECIEALAREKQAKDLLDSKSKISQQVDALARQTKTEDLLSKIDGMDGEQARRIKFYRSIIEGKIKSVRITTKKNAAGIVVETKIEELADVDSRIRARKELDKLLGLQAVIDMGDIQVGDITINIVDASKKEELADSRNTVDLDMGKIENIDGEEVIVVDKKEEQVNSKKQDSENEEASEADKFFESLGENNE